MKQHTQFTTDQLNRLRASFAGIVAIDPDRLPDFHRMFEGCSTGALCQLSGANIKFLSKLARNAVLRRQESIADFKVRLASLMGPRPTIPAIFRASSDPGFYPAN